MGKFVGLALIVISFAILGLFATIALGLTQGGGGTTACAAEGPGRSYLVGDSIGVGLKPHLQNFTVNAEGGRTLAQGLAEVGQDREAIKAAGAVVIELGTNVSDGFEGDAREMVRRVKAANGSATIFWVEIFAEGDSRYAAQNKVIDDLGVSVIRTKGKGISMSDRAHPDADGYKKLAGIITDAVKASGGGTDSDDTTGQDDCPPADGGGSTGGRCSADGLAFGLPSSNVADREKVFGKANSEAAKQPVTFFGHQLQAHEKVVPCLEAVEREIKAQGADDYQVRSAGAYNERPGEPLHYFHMYGAAIDINPDTNPRCDCDTHDIPMTWVKAFRKYGFFWGGNFRTTKDWMHFEWHGEAP